MSLDSPNQYQLSTQHIMMDRYEQDLNPMSFTYQSSFDHHPLIDEYGRANPEIIRTSSNQPYSWKPFLRGRLTEGSPSSNYLNFLLLVWRAELKAVLFSNELQFDPIVSSLSSFFSVRFGSWSWARFSWPQAWLLLGVLALPSWSAHLSPEKQSARSKSVPSVV